MRRNGSDVMWLASGENEIANDRIATTVHIFRHNYNIIYWRVIFMQNTLAFRVHFSDQQTI